MAKAYAIKAGNRKSNVLVYGYPGVGKTALAATANDHPKMKDVLFINVEGGLMSVRASEGLWAEDVHSYDDLERVFWALANGKEAPYKNCHTVVIDSGTELQNILLEEEVKNAGRADPNQITLRDYGNNTTVLRRMFRWFRDLPLNVIVTALVRKNYPKGVEDTSLITPDSICPAFTEKLGESVMGYFDFVWYMYIKEGQRYLLTQDSGPYRAKTRGMSFSRAIGNKVEVSDLWEEEPTGHTLATLFDLLLKSE